MYHSTASPSCDASMQISFQSSFISKQDYFYDKYSPILELYIYLFFFNNVVLCYALLTTV